MVDKPRSPRRSGASAPARFRGPGTGKNGERSERFGRPAGKPVKGPARPQTVAGVDLRALEVLEREGLLSSTGRKLRAGGSTARLARTSTRPAEPAPAPRGKGRQLGAAESVVAQRLHKVMAQAGIASRRHSEELIQAGRVTVNGQVVTELGTKVVPGKDLIEVDGRSLGKPENQVYILMNKPKGYVTTLYDPEGRKKVGDLLGGDISERIYPVGRLDYETEGLLLLTNDGELANALMHPARMVRKTYIAKVRGVPGPAKIKALESGIELDDGPTAPAEVRMIDVKPPNAATLSVRLHEGRNRQVRRMFEAVGHEVIHLKRTTLGPLHLRDLEIGQWRELTQQELSDLRKATGLKALPLEKGDRQAAAPRPAGRRGGVRVIRPAAAAGAPAADAPLAGHGPVAARPVTSSPGVQTGGPRRAGIAAKLGTPTPSAGVGPRPQRRPVAKSPVPKNRTPK